MKIRTADGRRLKVDAHCFTSKGAKTMLLKLCVLCGIIFYKFYILTVIATVRTHHFPTHKLRMSTHTRSAVPGMGDRSSVGRVAQVSREWRAGDNDGRNRGRESFNITTNSEFVLVICQLIYII